MAEQASYNLLVILGPTASGKTALAVRYARYCALNHGRSGEIISADSRQVYRGMDLGTGKDKGEFVQGGDPVPCHLVDVADPDYEYNLFEYQKAFYRLFREIQDRGTLPIMAGGTGLYIESVTESYDLPEALGEAGSDRFEELSRWTMESLERRFFELRADPPHNITDLKDRTRLVRAIIVEESRLERTDTTLPPRPQVAPFIVGVRLERDLLRRLIRKRLIERIHQGMIEEVQNLYAGGIGWERLDSFGLEYRYISRHLRGELAREEMIDTLSVKIGQFAKRQETWFRRMERKGAMIHWIDYGDFDSLKDLVDRHVFGVSQP